ncbi:MAG: SDR family NAD(P)-dependent oxidoreductase [Anaerolineales bacterium]
MRLQNKNAIVTGAGSGIGRAIALGYAKEGSRVICADINLPAAQHTVEAIKASGGEALAAQVDVSQRAQVEAMVGAALAAYERIHVLVSVAGIATVRHFLDLPEDEWDRVLDVNLKGLYLCGQAVGRHMAQSGGGVIINVTSQVADVAQPDCAHYYASKGGGKQLTKAMAVDLARFNIRVNALAPGLTNTGMTKSTQEAGGEKWSYRQKILDHIPMGRPAEPEEMVGAAVFLASDESSYMTGASLVVDGGYTAI